MTHCAFGAAGVRADDHCDAPPGTVVAGHSLSHVQLFATPWTIAHQDSLALTVSWSLLKLMSIELVMPSNHIQPSHPLSSPSPPRQEEKGGAMEDEMLELHHQFNGHEFEQTLGDSEGQGNLACCSQWGCKELDTTK